MRDLLVTLVFVAVSLPPMLAQRSVDAVLIVNPIPSDPAADSAYVVDVATSLRRRLMPWRRNVVRTIPLCPGNFCGDLLSDSAAHRLAQIMAADFYIVGDFQRNEVGPRVDLRVMEAGNQGGIAHYSTSLTVQADSAILPTRFANLISRVLRDTLLNAMRGAHDARRCWWKLSNHDYAGARGEAEDALRRYPNHPSAATCLSFVFAFTEKSDSVTWALERAVVGDSTLEQAWGRLGDAYIGRGDTTRAVIARAREVSADARNVERRLRVARFMDVLGEHETAVEIISGGSEAGPDDDEMRQLLIRMCMGYRMWQCALDALTDRYDYDSTLVGDTTFYRQVIGLAQELSDTALVAQWTDEAVVRVGEVVVDAWRTVEMRRREARRVESILRDLQMARAQGLVNSGDREGAIVAYRDIWEADPDQVRARVAAARLLTERKLSTVGGLVTVDSLQLERADSWLTIAADRTDDEDLLRAVSMSYYEVGAELVRERVAPELASAWLEKAVRHDPDSSIFVRGNAFLGLALLYQLEEVDAQLREQQTCELLDREVNLITRARDATAIAEREHSLVAEQVIQGLDGYEELVPQLSEILGCSGQDPG